MNIKSEILASARRAGFRHDVLEKDYMLGWLLWGISQHEQLGRSWVFKGGTCFKKCFIETYRLSEDLDFTLEDPSHLDEGFLRAAFADIAERIREEAGIGMPAEMNRFELYRNPHGNLSCQCRIYYRGPVSPKRGNAPRVKLDITSDERLVLPPRHSQVLHPYGHAPDGSISVRSYQFTELVAEKTRALAQRTAGRDLYDLMRVFRDTQLRPDAAEVLEVLKEKCHFRGIDLPNMSKLESRRHRFEKSWRFLLEHQLMKLPPIATYWDDLPSFLDWILNGVKPLSRDADSIDPHDLHALIKERHVERKAGTKVQGFLERLRFAAANRFCVDIVGGEETDRVEAYSLRRGWDGEAVLHAHEISSNQTRMYRMNEIVEVKITDQAFTPRYRNELNPEHPGHAVSQISQSGEGRGGPNDTASQPAPAG